VFVKLDYKVIIVTHLQVLLKTFAVCLGYPILGIAVRGFLVGTRGIQQNN